MPAGAADTGAGSGAPSSTQMQREAARRTAEKIDQIESEMIASGLPVPPPPNRVQTQLAVANAKNAPVLQASAPGNATAFAPSTSIVIGNTENADEILINGATLPPELEEAAILYANGQANAAAATLKQAISTGSLGTGSQQAWLMLFDVYAGSGLKAEFDSLSLDFAAQYEQSPPAWRDDSPNNECDKPTAAGVSVLFPAMVDAGISKQLEQMRKAIAGKRALVLEFVSVQSIDHTAAAALVSAIDVCKVSKSDVLIANSTKMLDAAKANIEVGRRDDSVASWMLALEMLRLQGLKQQFDDLSIDYCVTFEVSPPSWEPMPAWVRGDTLVAAVGTQIIATAAAAGEAGSFPLAGEIAGRIQKELAALRAYAVDRQDLVIDCRTLARLDFVAAGELLNEVVTLRSAGKTIVFVEPNYVVLALMKVMGIHELADIRRPKS